MKWRNFEPAEIWPFSATGKYLQHRPIDPYATWASVTGFRSVVVNAQFLRAPGESWVNFIAEATSVDALDDLVKERREGKKWVFVSNAYDAPDRRATAGLDDALHFTGRVRVRHLGDLNLAKGIKRWELGLAATPPEEADEENDALALGRGGSVREFTDTKNARTRENNTNGDNSDSSHNDGMPELATLERNGVVCVIDFGAAIFNQSFTSGKKTRVACLWDQHQRIRRGPGGKDPAGWDSSFGFGYGRVLTARYINALRTATGSGDDAELYRAATYLQQRADPSRPLKRATHGTHVLDLAAGHENPWARFDDSLRREPDAASKAWLHFVHLPIQTAVDSSGGSLSVHVLDAVRDAMLRYPPSVPLMVVLSQGTHAGPHDGSTLIERALDELLSAREENFAIVIGAGNGRLSQDQQPVGCHAIQTVNKDKPATFSLHLPPGDTTDTFVEIWYSKPVSGSLSVRLLPPSPLSPSEPVGAGQHSAGLDQGSVRCALMHMEETPGGDGQMILLALAPTEGRRQPHVATGGWRIEVTSNSTDPVKLDAWVERDDPLIGASADWPRFFGDGVCVEGTINTLATGKHTLVAGAMRHDSRNESPYSAHGPLRGTQVSHPVPTVLVAADESAARPGVLAGAVRSGESHRMSGTSVAAPTLARLLFNKMMASHKPVKRDEWRSLIKALAADHAQMLRIPEKPPGGNTGEN